MKEIVVDKKFAGQKLIRYLEKYLSNASAGFIYKMLRKKNITLNNSKASGDEKLECGDCIRIFFSDETLEKFTTTSDKAQDVLYYKKIYKPLDVIYENDEVLFINKPVGMLSQKAAPTDVSLVEYLTAHLLNNGTLTESEALVFKGGICNRLDRNTSGIVAAGKTIKGLQTLNEAFKSRNLGKFYLCIVDGVIKNRALIKGFIVKNEKTNRVEILDSKYEGAVPIETEYIPVCNNGRVTLVKIHLLTGKSHQIRAHLASIGHALAGDYKYGRKAFNDEFADKYNINYQLLHSFELEIPDMGIHIYAQIPECFMKVMKGEKLCRPGIQEDLEALH